MEAMKSAGQQHAELRHAKPGAVYSWTQAASRVRSLHVAIFDDHLPMLIIPDVLTKIQACNAARKQGFNSPGEYWPIDIGCGAIVGRGDLADTTKLTSHADRRRIRNYERKSDLNNTCGEGSCGIGWLEVCVVLQAMVAPKKKKDFQ